MVENEFRNPNLIMKNGVYLFTRYILVMFISFYTTRLTLQVLGDEDYGINNVVGGIISMFAIVSMPITSSLQRYFNVEFARKKIQPVMVFNTAIRIMACVVLAMSFLYETIGLYVVEYILKYPASRYQAVIIIFQLTAVMTLFSFANIPFTALLYAKENMGIPAAVEFLINIYRVIYLLFIPLLSCDSLILFSLFLLLGYTAQFLYYFLYCRSNYSETKLCRQYDKDLAKCILRFSGWSSIEAAAGLSMTYLTNIIINVFGGVLYNTAYGLSMSLNSALLSFTTNLTKAVEPQITSSTTINDDNYRNQLVLTSIRLSLMGIGFVVIFFFFNGAQFLSLWLGVVPKHAYDFCLSLLIAAMFSSIILPLRTLIVATGIIKKYFISYGALSCASLILMYVLMNCNWPVITVVLIYTLCQMMMFFVAIMTVCRVTSIKFSSLFQAINWTSLSLLITFISYWWLNQLTISLGWYSVVLNSVLSVLVLLFSMYLIGTTRIEKKAINKIVNRIIK